MKSATSSRDQLLLERVEVVPGNPLEPGQERAEAVGELGVRVRRQRPERQPVEAVLRREHARAPGRRAAELDRRLDRLGARAREERAPDARRRAAQQLLREQRRQHVDADLHRARPLQLERLDQGLAHTGIVAPDVEHAEAAEHVQVAVAVAVPEVRALGPRPLPVEPDRPQQPDELRVDRLRVEVERLGAALVDQLRQPAHAGIIATRRSARRRRRSAPRPARAVFPRARPGAGAAPRRERPTATRSQPAARRP